MRSGRRAWRWRTGNADDWRRLPSAAAVALTVAVPAAAGTIHADEAAREPESPLLAQAADTETFDIPSQPLGDALDAFIGVTGWQVGYSSALARGLRSARVEGNLTPTEALARLLDGTGLIFELTSADTVTLAKAGAQDGDGRLRLGPITVEGETSERTYDAGTSVVRGNRLGQTLLETPRAVSVVTRSVLDDQRPDNEADILRNVSGVNRINAFQAVYQRFHLRGIFADNAYSYLRDGYRVLHLTDPAPYNLEQVEVIKGPNSIDFGRSTPGGFINYVTKRPLDDAQYALEVTAGSFDQYQANVDLTGPLNADKTVLYRLTAGYESGGAFTDHVDPLRRGVAGALAWSITPRTRLNLTADFQKTERLANPGWPVPDPSRLESADALPDDAFYGDANLEYDLEEFRYSFELLHDLSDDWRIRAKYAKEDFTRDNNFISLRGLTPDGNETRRLLFQRLNHRNDLITTRVDLRGDVTTWRIRHDILAGLDYYRFKSKFPRSFRFVTLPNLPVFNPPFRATPIPAIEPETANDDLIDYGVFIQDSIDFGRGWKLQLGVRHDILENDDAFDNVSQTSPTAAISYSPFDSSLIYASYSRSFEPNWGVELLGGGVADPSKGEQFEVGVKQGWFDDRFTTTASLFALTKTNIAVSDPENTGFDILTGEAEVKGIELEAAGELLPGLNVIGQVTLLDTEVTEDTDATIIGNKLTGSVESTASLWATYQLPGNLDGWAIGGGVFYTGERALNDSNTLSLPGYTTVDAFVGYRITGAISAQLNVTNIADKRYYATAGTSGDTFRSVTPGEPRAVSFTLRASF